MSIVDRRIDIVNGFSYQSNIGASILDTKVNLSHYIDEATSDSQYLLPPSGEVLEIDSEY